MSLKLMVCYGLSISSSISFSFGIHWSREYLLASWKSKWPIILSLSKTNEKKGEMEEGDLSRIKKSSMIRTL